MTWELGSNAFLRPVEAGDAEAILACVDRNRERLRPWMGWTDATRSLGDVENFIERSRSLIGARPAGLECCIIAGGHLCGMAGLNRLSWPHRNANLGYWIDAGHEGRGLVTAACGQLLAHAFDVWRLYRVAIQVATGNTRSRAVALRLGAVHEGTLRAAERVGDTYLDLDMFSILLTEWRERRVSPQRS